MILVWMSRKGTQIMDEQQFLALAEQGYTRIPVMREILADLDTPLSAYYKLANQAYSYLLESVEGGDNWGRYSIIGLPCQSVIKISGQTITIEEQQQVIETAVSADPFAWLEQYLQRYKIPELADLPRFYGGLVGYFGYDSIQYIEPKLANQALPDPLQAPDILLMVSDELLVFDNLAKRLYFIVGVDPSRENAYQYSQQRLDQLITQLRQTVAEPKHLNTNQVVTEADFVSGFKQADFEVAVNKIKDYIVEGDVMQVVLSQRLSIPYDAPALDLYRALRSMNPSPYMYYLDLGDYHIVGSSPEILTRVENNKVTVRPIAGTRPRGNDPTQDKALEQELLADPKELAEHLMLIDLGRNDVGRVAKIGSVKLTDRMVIERYSHVMHIVSNVEGQLNLDLSVLDALQATFPAGTVSGAPKIRAMEIIAELEPVKRGIYSGAVGYLSWSGNMDTAIAIRTAVIHKQTLYIQAGAGIVADSVPEKEWQETLNKGRAIFRAVAMATAGLDQCC